MGQSPAFPNEMCVGSRGGLRSRGPLGSMKKFLVFSLFCNCTGKFGSAREKGFPGL